METKSIIYCIRVGAYLDAGWSEWFAPMEITHTKNGDTLMTGLIRDQAMLYGVLIKLHNLGLPLISVIPAPGGAEEDE
jgi:hypothetical protein